MKLGQSQEGDNRPKFADMPEPGGHPLAAVIAKHIRAAADELEQPQQGESHGA